MCKRDSPDKTDFIVGYVRETPRQKEANTGCVRETPHIKTKSAWDV